MLENALWHSVSGDLIKFLDMNLDQFQTLLSHSLAHRLTVCKISSNSNKQAGPKTQPRDDNVTLQHLRKYVRLIKYNSLQWPHSRAVRTQVSENECRQWRVFKTRNDKINNVTSVKIQYISALYIKFCISQNHSRLYLFIIIYFPACSSVPKFHSRFYQNKKLISNQLLVKPSAWYVTMFDTNHEGGFKWSSTTSDINVFWQQPKNISTLPSSSLSLSAGTRYIQDGNHRLAQQAAFEASFS